MGAKICGCDNSHNKMETNLVNSLLKKKGKYYRCK